MQADYQRLPRDAAAQEAALALAEATHDRAAAPDPAPAVMD